MLNRWVEHNALTLLNENKGKEVHLKTILLMFSPWKIALIGVVWLTKCRSSWFLVLWFGSCVIKCSLLAIRTDSRTRRNDEATNRSLQKIRNSRKGAEIPVGILLELDPMYCRAHMSRLECFGCQKYWQNQWGTFEILVSIVWPINERDCFLINHYSSNGLGDLCD